MVLFGNGVVIGIICAIAIQHLFRSDATLVNHGNNIVTYTVVRGKDGISFFSAEIDKIHQFIAVNASEERTI